MPVLLLAAAPAHAKDWQGFYAGAHMGGADGASDAQDPFGGFKFGNSTNEKGPLFGGQAGYNFQDGDFVYGAEGSFDLAALTGTATCLSGRRAGRCTPQINSLATLTGRLGYTDGANLFFAKAGLAWMDDNESLLIFNDPPESAQGHLGRIGWTVGAGLEHKFAPGWSYRFEYDYAGFGAATFDFAVPRAIRFDNHVHMLTVGVNYWFDAADDDASTGAADDIAQLAGEAPSTWALEVAGRYFGAVDNMKKDINSDPTNENSRLIYRDMPVRVGEVFGRVDHASGWFLTGSWGIGSLDGGVQNDEDTPHADFGNGLYSNSISNLHHGSISYENLGVGFNFVDDAAMRLGAFVGYAHLHQKSNAIGCTQLALNNYNCPPGGYAPTDLVTIEDESWYSARLGFNGKVALAPDLSLESEVAYLPDAFNDTVDHHVGRDIIFREPGQGDGVQLESLLSYQVTDNVAIGAGARYWQWHAPRGMNQCTLECGNSTRKYIEGPFGGTHDTDQFGGFAQVSYSWGNAVRDTPDSAYTPDPFDWTGFYLGADAGARQGKSLWHTTCLGTPCSTGAAYLNANAIPFDDGAAYLGALGGYLLEPADNWLVGAEGDIGWGNNSRTGQNIWINYLPSNSVPPDPATVAEDFDGSFRLRGGYLVTPSTFAYLSAGLAVQGATITVMCNGPRGHQFNWCDGPTRSDSASGVRVGWTAGLGVESAIDDDLSLRGEYRYSDEGSFTHTFLAIASNPEDTVTSRTDLRESRLVAGLVFHLR